MPSPQTSTNRQIFTVSSLNRQAKRLLENGLPIMWIEGELSNFAMPSSGHWYFTLKDERAQVRCAMFKGRNRLVRFKTGSGQKVLLRASVSLYEGRGDYQLIVEHMEPAGLGDLQRQFEALKQGLQDEGLFSPDYKMALPSLPQSIAVITSPTGAAIRDILSVLQRRFPAIPITLLPVMVQGDGAAQEIAAAIRKANEHDIADVLIIGRGGGSLEDLWAFNEEAVARAIFECDIPTISAVGHETDVCIADFVADVRAATPSAAAELATPDSKELANQLYQTEQYLKNALLQKISSHRSSLELLRQRLVHPAKQIELNAQRLDHLELQLNAKMVTALETTKSRLSYLSKRLYQANPHGTTNALRQRLEQQFLLLQHHIRHHIELNEQKLGQAGELLHSLSPLNTLRRGYAVATKADGELIRDASQVAVGDQVSIKLARGKLTCDIAKRDTTD